MGIRIRWQPVALACALALASLTAAADELTDRARRLIEQGQGKQAYALLLPQESARAGDPEFDHLLGIAAIDAGENERAIFALERVLALQPDNHVARADIARAYLASGERETARREFETVRRQQIPEPAKATIDRFLSAIAAAEQTQVTGYIELGLGHDTNVNAATGSGQIAIPSLGGIIVTLNQGATRRSDNFAALSGGVNVTHKLAPEWALVASAAASARFNEKATEFDTLSYEGNLGVRWARQKNAFTVGAQAQTFELDASRYRETRGVVGQWQHTLDDKRQVTLFGQHSQLRYPTQGVRNADRQILGLGYGHAFDGEYTPVLFTSVYGGREKELSSGVPHLGHDVYGGRAGLQMRVASGLTAFVNASYEERKFGGQEPLFLVTRTDRQTDVGGGLTYSLRPGTTVTGQLNHTDNRSNVALNRFTRTLASVSLRVSF